MAKYSLSISPLHRSSSTAACEESRGERRGKRGVRWAAVYKGGREGSGSHSRAEDLAPAVLHRRSPVAVSGGEGSRWTSTTRIYFALSFGLHHNDEYQRHTIASRFRKHSRQLRHHDSGFLEQHLEGRRDTLTSTMSSFDPSVTATLSSSRARCSSMESDGGGSRWKELKRAN